MTILDKKGFCLLLAVLLLMLGQASASQDDTPFIRMDRDDPGAWKGELDSVRLLTGHLYEFGPVNDKYGIDPDYVPSDEGLSTLNISGSAQFSEPQFARLAETLRQCANEKRVIIVDLRQERIVCCAPEHGQLRSRDSPMRQTSSFGEPPYHLFMIAR